MQTALWCPQTQTRTWSCQAPPLSVQPGTCVALAFSGLRRAGGSPGGLESSECLLLTHSGHTGDSWQKPMGVDCISAHALIFGQSKLFRALQFLVRTDLWTNLPQFWSLVNILLGEHPNILLTTWSNIKSHVWNRSLRAHINDNSRLLETFWQFTKGRAEVDLLGISSHAAVLPQRPACHLASTSLCLAFLSAARSGHSRSRQMPRSLPVSELLVLTRIQLIHVTF